MKVDMADKEMLRAGQSKSEEELREKCGVISDQRAVGTGQPRAARSVFCTCSTPLTPIYKIWK